MTTFGPVRLIIAASAIAFVFASPSAAAPAADFDERMDALLQASGTPGAAVAIVEAGQPPIVRAYGVRRLGRPGPVGANTVFPIASVSKAFTSAALGILVDEGKLGWDDPVIDHLPQFQMHDPWVTREMTVRDLLVHRSGLGLGAGDLLFWPRSTRTRADTVKALRHLPPTTSFRSGYAYDNVLYIVAGQLIEAVSGQTWETFVQDRILAPAGMATAVVTSEDLFASPDRATPHARLNGEVRGLGAMTALDEGHVLSANAAPAGGIAASAEDMGRWIALQLARGALADGRGRLFSAATAEEMWTPQTLIPRNVAAVPPGAAPLFSTYALGWRVIDYRGYRIIWHTGGIIGFRSVAVLAPELNVGFAILTNAEDTGLIMGLMYELLDHYADPVAPRQNWPEQWAELMATRAEARVEERLSKPSLTRPPLPLNAYIGAYRDPWYGPITVVRQDDRLVMDFPQTPGLRGVLAPWSGDTFLAEWEGEGYEPALVTYAFTAEGEVEEIRVKAASPLADFSYDFQDLRIRPAGTAGAPE
ncbi:serine hydrolase [Phenylobacterium sp.]|uniref:serine hydrolase n=1 Tax=Phenylobacterium sp. TaxID=1871053 RepID=UPI002731D1F9|nr:serine hydrolase [Phenylobacterium sp.]MDP1618056.1 serine hydrolase [Phenylobacterium sp.]MDP1987283.1 serine hydrolase [Phenylobacterium sp.]